MGQSAHSYRQWKASKKWRIMQNDVWLLAFSIDDDNDDDDDNDVTVFFQHIMRFRKYNAICMSVCHFFFFPEKSVWNQIMSKMSYKIVQAIFVITTHCLFSALSLSSSEEDDTLAVWIFCIEAVICILFMAVEFNQRCTQCFAHVCCRYYYIKGEPNDTKINALMPCLFKVKTMICDRYNVFVIG